MGKRYVKRKEIVRRFEWKRFQVILTFHHGNIDRWRGTCRVVSENWGELSQNSLWRWVNWTNDTALERKLSGQSIDKRIHAIFCTFFLLLSLNAPAWNVETSHHATRAKIACLFVSVLKRSVHCGRFLSEFRCACVPQNEVLRSKYKWYSIFEILGHYAIGFCGLQTFP